MKKIILLSIFALSLFVTAQAQSSYTLKHSNGGAQDTVDNTETRYLTLATTVPQNRLFASALFVYSYTEASGTSAGTATLQVSANGTTWANVWPDSSHAQYAAFTHTDVTTEQVKTWLIVPSSAYSYRIAVTGSGTMSGIIKASVVFKNF